jgi:hypothetical protein
MYLQEILEVAIGLVFVWLVISVATMTINEWISNLLNSRAKAMEKVITQMLASKDLTRQFYEYPLISNLYPRSKNPGKKPRLPSYIPPVKFGATLFELVIQAGTDNSPVQAIADGIDEQLASIQSPEQQKLAREDWNAILESTRNFAASGLGATALDSLKLQIQIYGEKNPEVKPSIDQLLPQVDAYYGQFVKEQHAGAESGIDTGLAMRQFRLGMLAMQKTNPDLTRSVTALVRQAENYALRADAAVAATRVNIETWFNDAMEQLSAAYKRKAQFWAFFIGVFLALLINVDSINVATSLWREPTLRQVILNEAKNYTPPAASQDSLPAGPLETIPALQTQLQALNIPFGWTTAPINTGARQCALLPLKPSQVWGIPSLDDQGVPICKNLSNLPIDAYGWFVKILGLLMTGAAAAQGAPFWFDILGKLVNIRSTGSTKEKAAVG